MVSTGLDSLSKKWKAFTHPRSTSFEKLKRIGNWHSRKRNPVRLCALGHLVVVQEVSCANKVLTRDVGDLVVHAVISGTKYKGKRIGEAASFLFLVIKKSSPSGRGHSSKVSY